MSTEFRFDTVAIEAIRRGGDPALYHIGDYSRLLRYHCEHIARRNDDPAIPPVEPLLLARIADSRTMLTAINDRRQKGGDAPGPNGHQLAELEPLKLARDLAHLVKNGEYCPAKPRLVRLPKLGKPGEYRTIALQNVEDRVIGRAATLVLDPFFDPTFSPFSFGFRRGIGPLHALGTAFAFAETYGLWTWVAVDVASAFDNVPFKRFLDILRRRKLPDDLIEFIEVSLYTGKPRGFPMGSTLAPLCFNLFCDHFIDRPWHRDNPERPHLRYADDILIPCGSLEEAATLYAAVRSCCQTGGLPLKTEKTEIVDLADAGSLTWLGFVITLGPNGPQIRISDRAWQALHDRLSEAHLHPAPPILADQIVKGWVSYLGPAVPFENIDQLLSRVYEIASALSFTEISSREELCEQLSTSYDRWASRRCIEQANLDGRLSMVQERVSA